MTSPTSRRTVEHTKTGPGPSFATAIPTPAPSGPLTDAQKTTLAAIMEEQQLANDLYHAFTNTCGTSVFGCVTNEETLRLTETRNVLTTYAVADPTAGTRCASS